MYQTLSIPGFSVARHYGEVTSTMDIAREVISIEPIGANWNGVITADNQTSGRGRQGRKWLSGGQAFMGTFIFATSLPVAHLSGYSLAVGVALADGLRSIDVPIQLKWPNDLVHIDSGRIRKLGGILIEVQELGSQRCVLVGVGVNNRDLPSEVSAEATSIRALTGEDVELSLITRTLSTSLHAAHQRFVAKGGFADFVDRWRELTCFRTGVTRLEIDLGENQEEGTYCGVSSSGALVLDVNGVERLVHSGHVTKIVL